MALFSASPFFEVILPNDPNYPEDTDLQGNSGYYREVPPQPLSAYRGELSEWVIVDGRLENNLCTPGGGGGTDVKVAVDSSATADFLGATDGVGALRVDGTTIAKTDNGNSITLGVLSAGLSVAHADTTGQTTDDHHPQVHTIVSHDTTGTGANLTELTDGSETTLHSHPGGSAAFGDGSDGAYVSSGDLTLTRDMYHTTFSNSHNLFTSGFKVFALTSMVNTGLIRPIAIATLNGANGSNGSGATGGGGGAGGISTGAGVGSIWDGDSGIIGGAGGNGAPGIGDGSVGVAGASGIPEAGIGNTGKDGSAAGAGGNATPNTGGVAGAGGSGGVLTALTAVSGGVRDLNHLTLWRSFPPSASPIKFAYNSGSAGSGGGGGGAGNGAGTPGGGAGGGGAGAVSAAVYLASPTIDNSGGTISVSSGAGGDGGDGAAGVTSPSAGGGAGAGGSGGNGSTMVLVYNSFTSGTESVAGGAAGTGGTGGAGDGADAGANGANGNAGDAGEIIQFDLSA